MKSDLLETGPESTLLASGLGDDTGGGVYALTDDGVETIDGRSTVGLAVAPDGSRLARLLWDEDDASRPGELLLYDADGVAGHRRLDALREPHGAVWHADGLVVVSTLANAILRLGADGAPVRTWQAPGEGDCWHLNNVAVRHGRLIASAFGRFEAHRGWADPAAREGAGIVFEVETGRELVTGLTCPHDPHPVVDGMLVCNSGTRELLHVGPDGRMTRRVELGGWTRGLAVDAERVYVGVSAHRLLGAEGCARVVELERSSLRELRSWALPCREVFSLAFATAPLLAGLRASVTAYSAV